MIPASWIDQVRALSTVALHVLAASCTLAVHACLLCELVQSGAAEGYVAQA